MHAPSQNYSLPSEPPLPKYHWILHRFACFCAGSILFLICIGGLVTSHEAGMSVPDWPNTYGYNMFFFPLEDWVGGIFYEHSHRLVAFGVSTLVTILAIGLCFQERIWLRWMGIVAPVFFLLEGTLGGLRVVLSEDVLGVFHGCLAQLLFIAISLIALFTSRWWINAGSSTTRPSVLPKQWTGRSLAICALIFCQLILGATMRHEHLGLSIHDFPLAYGQVWPDTSAAAVDQYNLARSSSEKPTTALAINLQMAHRVGAVLVTVSILAACAAVWLTPGSPLILRRWTTVWVCLVLTQFLLGAFTIWTNKAADIATTHVAVGALTLITGALLTAISWRLQWRAEYVTRGIA